MQMLLGYTQFVCHVLYAHVMKRPRVHVASFTSLALLIMVLTIPSFGFPSGTSLSIRSDETFREAAEDLEAHHIVPSAFLLRALARLTGTDDAVQAGRYAFPAPTGTAVILYRLVNGITETPTIRVTFPEGITVNDMADTLAHAIPGFDTDAFRDEAQPYEGYLFPDTYEFPPDVSADEVVERMRLRFKAVWAQVMAELPPHAMVRADDSLPRIVTMASLLEKETKPGEGRSVVSGILWHRVDIGMPLQVDAVFGYIKGIDTYHPSGKDLDIDSPYNTYTNKDLPPGPIGNPGEDALRAALLPHSSPYLYYLTDADGNLHYAATFEEHKANKARYLK